MTKIFIGKRTPWGVGRKYVVVVGDKRYSTHDKLSTAKKVVQKLRRKL